MEEDFFIKDLELLESLKDLEDFSIKDLEISESLKDESKNVDDFINESEILEILKSLKDEPKNVEKEISLEKYIGNKIFYQNKLHHWSKKNRRYFPVMLDRFLYTDEFCISGDLIYQWSDNYKRYLPIANDRHTKVGRIAIFKGSVHTWRTREGKISGYGRNGVNYKI